MVKERREQFRAAGVKFDERSHSRFGKAYAKGTLLSGLCGKAERYNAGRGDPNRLQAKARAMKHRLPTWEGLLIKPGAPWATYVPTGARQGAQAAIDDAKPFIPFV